MSKETIEQFKKEKNEQCDKEIVEFEISIADLKKQHEKGLGALEEKLEFLKYQKELFK